MGRENTDIEYQSTSNNLRALFDSIGAYVYVKDAQGRYLYANKAVCELYQRDLSQVLGLDDSHFFNMEHSQALLQNDLDVLTLGSEIHQEEEVVLRHEQQRRLFWTIKVPIRSTDGRIVGLSGISSPLTADKLNTDNAIRHNQLMNTILSNVDAYIYVKDNDGTYLYANKKVIELYGTTTRDIIGRTDHDVHAPEIARQLIALDREVLDNNQRQAREEVVHDTAGIARHFWSIKIPIALPGHPSALIGFSSEITELLTLRRDLELKRTTDALTGLRNRLALEEMLERQLADAARRSRAPAVLMLDLDQFKYLNNTLGQQAGDEVLRQVAQRLEGASWLKGQPARVGSNAFAVVLPRVTSAEEAASLAERVRLRLAEPYVLDNQPFQLTASLGISLYPHDGKSPQLLLANAESAMYHAKDQGRNQCCFYSASLGEAVSRRLDLERDLRCALEAGQFELYYQPKIAADNGRTVGLEALIRWNRTGHGLVPPDQFIPLAEQLGLIVSIGDWVVEQACRQMSQWSAEGISVPIAVNLSPAQLSSPDLIQRVSQLLSHYQIPRGHLHMEVTESMMMHDPALASVHLQQLSALGVELSIDDFGTGYSSMAYLKRLPVQTIKLDRSFVERIAEDQRDADLCAGLIALAHKLSLQVVAEGVETEAQRAILAALDCDLFQGYLFSRPLPSDQAAAYLRQHR